MGLPKPPLSWRVLDLLKVEPSPKQSHNSLQVSLVSQSKDVHKCACCGTVVSFVDGATKFRCVQCSTTNLMIEFDAMESLCISPPLSFASVKAITDDCLAGPKARNSHELHNRLKPLVDYLHKAFGNLVIINEAFKLKISTTRVRYSSSNLNLADFRHIFEFLTILPSKRPLFCALSALQHALNRLPVHLADHARNLYWVVLVFEIPFLHKALTISGTKSCTNSKCMVEMPEIRSLCYDLVRRVLGVLSQAELCSSGNYLASWFLKLPREEFLQKVDLINLYITFHLKKCFVHANNPELARRGSAADPHKIKNPSNPTSSPHQPKTRKTQKALLPMDNPSNDRCRGEPQGEDDEYVRFSYVKDDEEATPDNGTGWPHLRVSSNAINKNKPDGPKIRTFHYKSNYQLRTATAALGIFVRANYIRGETTKVPVYAFYNSLVDFVNMKLDFDCWLHKKRVSQHASTTEPAMLTVIDYIKGTTSLFDMGDPTRTDGFYFCQYPYLVSLGGKISILQYEARRQMERKAEEAFINSLDKRVVMDVYFKVRVRRDYIVQDSLQCIRINQDNLKKGIRVQFINEPGIDAGGLKKEWFLLLTRALFSPSTGMLHEVEDSLFLWFNIIPANNFEIYYLFGAVLGLAIYNSTILDLSFPLAFYKILLGIPMALADYKEVFPETARNLFKLRDYSAEELSAMNLTFEVSFHDSFGKHHERDLIENGASIPVTVKNREIYIDKYAHFFVSEGIKAQVRALKKGFSSIVDGNAFSLFLPEEIQLLLCGSDQSKIDVDVLQSVTQYTGWKTAEEALDSQVVQWFWNHLRLLTSEEQKRVLLFITGSDRIPATGIENLTLKLSRLNNGKDSDRLPVAHTCFNELALYEYSSEAKFTKKFTEAVTMLSGFGIK